MMSKMYNKEEKQKIIDEYETSGLSKAKYVKERGIPEATLRGWLKESSSIAFGELLLDGDKITKSTSTAKKPIVFGCENIKIELKEGYDKEFLKRIVEVLMNVKWFIKKYR